jgi:predicted nuclease with RNAse H fold
VIGFGLDPAGYCEGRSVLAVAKRNGSEAHVKILRNCPFSEAPDRNREIGHILANEQIALRTIATLGYVAIDVPIDLQGLPTVCAPSHLWQQTKRTVDKAVGGLEPLASFIGHVTARFQSIFCDAELNQKLGLKIFETYPKPAFKKLLPELWGNVRNYKKDASKRNTICDALHVTPSSEIKTHDDLDAVICALTAIASNDELWTESDYAECGVGLQELPRGYRILARNSFDEIKISTDDCAEWMRKVRSN